MQSQAYSKLQRPQPHTLRVRKHAQRAHYGNQDIQLQKVLHFQLLSFEVRHLSTKLIVRVIPMLPPLSRIEAICVDGFLDF